LRLQPKVLRGANPHNIWPHTVAKQCEYDSFARAMAPFCFPPLYIKVLFTSDFSNLHKKDHQFQKQQVVGQVLRGLPYGRWCPCKPTWRCTQGARARAEGGTTRALMMEWQNTALPAICGDTHSPFSSNNINKQRYSKHRELSQRVNEDR